MFEEDGQRPTVQGSGDRWKEDVRVPHAKAFVFEEEVHQQGAWWTTLSSVMEIQSPLHKIA
jgi:hypothetical protein